jgi:hypothetical protein
MIIGADDHHRQDDGNAQEDGMVDAAAVAGN